MLNCLFKKEQDMELPIRPATVWGKIYRKQFLVDNDIWFTSGMVLNEDVLFNAKLLKQKPRICTLQRKLYYYRINNSSSGSTAEKDIGNKLLSAAVAMKEFADCCSDPDISERVSLRIDSYIQRYFRKYIMTEYVNGYHNKRNEYMKYVSIPIFKEAREVVNINDIDFTGKLFYVCAERSWFFPLYLREKVRGAKFKAKRLLRS